MIYPFKQIEQEVSKLWKKEERSIYLSLQHEKNKKLFSFLEGPPTANAPPGLHHVEVRVFKDLFCRYKYMQGYTVPRKGGWDCHGLPVEVQIEKELNLNSKKEIISYGINNFIKKCRDSVFSHINEWSDTTKKMAYWVDLENPYITLDNNYIESVWWSLKELYHNSYLYEDFKVVPYCPRCQTPLSSHELALGYEDITENSIVVKFKLKDQERYLLAWTTTPWTLPSNLALAINPNIDYAIVKEKNNEYVLAKSLVKKYFPKSKSSKSIKGKELLNLSYEPLFDYFKNLDNAFKVVAADFVSIEEGTGIVHIAPAFGEDDYNVCKVNNIAFVQPVNQEGIFTSEVKDFEGKSVKDADPKIIEHLKHKHLLFKIEKYKHSYPFCWRCNTPLLYYAMKSWFIRVTKVKDKLIEYNKKINWFPSHIKEGRYGKFLESLRDWALSRSRFWGTPLPIWKCTCGNETIIGSIQELHKKGIKVKKNIDLHRPDIDEVKIKCDKCDKLMNRIPDVIDTWYDSGSATFAQFHYPFENKDLFESRFPYDFIAEALDQTRGWFHTLHVLGVLLFDKIAYKNVVVAGFIVDENNEKMSKSKGKIIMPDEMFDKVGVDSVRLQMCYSDIADNKRFSVNVVNESVLPFLNILWNCYQFTKEIEKSKNKDVKLSLEDKWIISRVNSLIKTINTNIEIHNYNHCYKAFEDFVVEDLSRTYIKMIRERASDKDPAVGYSLYYVFDRLLKILAPFAPYITEYIYQDLIKNEKSVHFEKWPLQDEINGRLESYFNSIKEIVQSTLFLREKVQLGIRWPLQEVIVVTKDEAVKNAVMSLEELIRRQLNVKKIRVQEKIQGLNYKIKPDFSKIHPLFKEKSAKIIAAFATLSQESIQRKIKNDFLILDLEDETIKIPRDCLIYEINLPSNLIENNFTYGTIYLDKTLTPQLIGEGYTRELVRKIQNLRKQAKLKKKDEINLYLNIDDEFKEMIKDYLNEIEEKVSANKIEFIIPKKFKHSLKEKIKDKQIEIYI